MIIFVGLVFIVLVVALENVTSIEFLGVTVRYLRISGQNVRISNTLYGILEASAIICLVVMCIMIVWKICNATLRTRLREEMAHKQALERQRNADDYYIYGLKEKEEDNEDEHI